MSYTIRVVGNYTTKSSGIIRAALMRVLLRLGQTRDNLTLIVPAGEEDGLQALVRRMCRSMQRVDLLESPDAVPDLLIKVKADIRAMRSADAKDAFSENYEKACDGHEGREEYELVYKVPKDFDTPNPIKVRTPPTGDYNDVDRGEPPFTVKTQKTIDRNKIPPKDAPNENFNLSGGRTKVNIVL